MSERGEPKQEDLIRLKKRKTEMMKYMRKEIKHERGVNRRGKENEINKGENK